MIVFIFLAGFIFAGTNASHCSALKTEPVIIQNAEVISHSTAFLEYENYIIKENIKSLKTNYEVRNSNFGHSGTTLSFENNNRNITFEKQYSLISSINSEQKFKDIKFKLFPRAP